MKWGQEKKVDNYTLKNMKECFELLAEGKTPNWGSKETFTRYAQVIEVLIQRQHKESVRLRVKKCHRSGSVESYFCRECEIRGECPRAKASPQIS
jgi:hypothetical protein